MIASNQIKFKGMNSELLASAIMYFEDFIAIMHKGLSQAGFSSFDAFSAIEITLASLTQSKGLEEVLVSLTDTLARSANSDFIIQKVTEFYKAMHNKEPEEMVNLIKYEGKYDKNHAELIIIFLNHLTANFLKIAKHEKSSLKSTDIENTQFTRLLSVIFDKAFEKTLAELKH